MEDLIESFRIFKKRLGENYGQIQRLDQLKDRSKEDRIKNNLKNAYGQRCAYCQREKEVIAAHIIPLAIGGPTVEDNMVLLCKDCHDKYDRGWLSTQAMQEVAQEWRRGTSTPYPLLERYDPPLAIRPPPSSVEEVLKEVRDNQRKGFHRKAITTLAEALANLGLDTVGESYLLIKCAELTRRRNKSGMLEETLKILKKVDITKLQEYIPVFYYEMGYVYRLKGNPIKAAEIFSRCAEASMNQENDISLLEYTAASANSILCSLAVEDSISQKKANDFVGQLQKLECISTKVGSYWGSRWALNCTAHRLQVYLKIRNEKESWITLGQLRERFYRSDLRTGWDEGTKPSMTMLEGLTRTLLPREDSDLRLGISLLARAFVTRINPRQRPEGIRDVGFGLIEGIQKSGINLTATIDVIEVLLNKTVDGTSVLWPWRAEND